LPDRTVAPTASLLVASLVALALVAVGAFAHDLSVS
jgi:hypothetical protein